MALGETVVLRNVTSLSAPVGMIASRDGLKPDTLDWLILACTLKEAALPLDLYTD